MNAPLKEKKQVEKTKALHYLAVEMITKLNVLLKSAKIYQPNNLLFRRQIEFFMKLIQKALEEAGEAHFTARQSTLFFNNIRLKYGYANYHFFRHVLQELKKKEIGGILFEPGLNDEDLTSFMLLLAKVEDKSTAPFKVLAEEMRDQDIHHIVLEMMLPAELAPRRERDAARVFFLGISHLEEAFETEYRQEKIKLNTTRRLMQAIFNHIVDNESFVQGLTNIKNFHEYTLNHSMNVCILSVALGRRLGLDRNELVDLGISSFFHDFGKLDTPKEILEKPSKLEDQEREIIEKHPYQGAQKLVHFKEFRNLPLRAIHVALEHHIKEDLTGYPRYFKRKTTNLFSKIVKITDVFDAITTKRVYRTKEFTRDEALNLMLAQSGQEFQPVLLREFVKMMGVYPVGTLVALTTGELGIVVENNSETMFLLRPKVRLITEASGNKIEGDVVDLSETEPGAKTYARTIVKTLDPEKYRIRVADYFLAQAE
jgi:HD-GYP domain-containing protein (c-di-GMP phosphodiesterase class II)